MNVDDLERDGANYLGKVRANFLGTEFVLYDKGLNPEDAQAQRKTAPELAVRQELGLAIYVSDNTLDDPCPQSDFVMCTQEPNLFGSKGPRKMQAIIPSLRNDNNRIVWRPLKADDSMLSTFKQGGTNGMIQLVNKNPKWHEGIGAYVLNFNGRVTVPSVKNFQMVVKDDRKLALLLEKMGKEITRGLQRRKMWSSNSARMATMFSALM